MTVVPDDSTTPPSPDEPATDAGATEPSATGAPTGPVGVPVAESRSTRRRTQGPARLPPAETVRRPRTVVLTVGLAIFLALAANADPVLFAVAVGLVGIDLAWGWQELFQAPAPTVPRVLIALVAAAGPAVVAVTPDEPYLRWSPAVVAGGLLAVLLHQLVRRDGRPRLTESVSISVGAIAILTCGVAIVPMARMFGGGEVVTATAAALAVGALADLLVGRRALHAWTVPLAMLLGGLAAAASALLTGTPRLGQALLLGFIVGGLSHALRRLLALLAPMAWVRCQLACAASSVLVVGVVVNVVSRVVLTL